MSQPTPDPTRWLTELMSTEHVMWPGLHIADTAKAMAAAAAPWTKAVAEITALQLEALKTLAAPWTALMPGVTPAAEPIKDRRFAGDAWTKDPRYEAVARTYLAQTDLMRKALAAAPIDEGSKAQWGFALQQVMDALSPANTLATNPEALQLAMETGGASLLEGMRLFTEDLAKGRIAMTDETAFEVGRNVGTTPGTVVFQNELIQLIQYTPTTEQGLRAPAGDHPAVHQQVLHPGSAARELLRRARGRRGPHGVPRVVAQRRPAAGNADLGRLRPRA